MYTAMFLACWLGTSQPCMQAIDNRGPYKTLEECEARLIVMIQDAREIWKQAGHKFMVVDTICSQEPGTKA